MPHARVVMKKTRCCSALAREVWAGILMKWNRSYKTDWQPELGTHLLQLCISKPAAKGKGGTCGQRSGGVSVPLVAPKRCGRSSSLLRKRTSRRVAQSSIWRAAGLLKGEASGFLPSLLNWLLDGLGLNSFRELSPLLTEKQPILALIRPLACLLCD